MDSILDRALGLLLPLLILLHLVFSPYSKVEESFNLQAVHDVLTYGVPTKDVAHYLKTHYDHFSFPGAVPRSFTGAVLLAALAKVGIALGIDRQLAVRGALGLFNAFALLVFQRAVARSFGRTAGRWYLILQASQFHVIYYASRTLPNMMAFGLTTLALSNLFPVASLTSPFSYPKKLRLAVYLLAISAVVLRAELALLLATVVLYQLVRRGPAIVPHILSAGLTGSLIGVVLTVAIDSFFWQRFPLWPELAGFYYNAIKGNAAAWGTSPWWFYFGNALPRLLLNPLTWQLCIPLALGLRTTRQASIDILAPLLGYVGIYSAQPHKEWRFIVYVIPGLTAVAALGATWIWNRRTKTLVYRFLALALVASTLASYGFSAFMLSVSRLNYPGAEAFQRVHALANGSSVVRVHSDTLSCTTGITRFLERAPATTTATATANGRTVWVYDKTEDPAELLSPLFWDKFDYALTETPERVIGRWETVDVVHGFAGLAFDRRPASSSQQQPKTGQSATEYTTTLAHGSSKPSRPAAEVFKLWTIMEAFVTKYITNGWWMKIKMEPKIYILRRQKGPRNLRV